MKKTIKQLEAEILELKKPVNNATVSNNVMYGVKWEADAIKSVQTVAQALLNLTELFKSQNINIEAMIKVGYPDSNESK